MFLFLFILVPCCNFSVGENLRENNPQVKIPMLTVIMKSKFYCIDFYSSDHYRNRICNTRVHQTDEMTNRSSFRNIASYVLSRQIKKEEQRFMHRFTLKTRKASFICVCTYSFIRRRNGGPRGTAG